MWVREEDDRLREIIRMVPDVSKVCETVVCVCVRERRVGGWGWGEGYM